jgi:NapC/NirT cytochrome c family protein
MRLGPLRHPASLAGVVLATAGGVGALTLGVAALIGEFHHPYAGLVVFVLLPAVLVLGLLLIPVGAWLQRRKIRRHPSAPQDWPVMDLRQPRVRRIALVVTALTAVNLVIVLLAGYGSLHWMESPTFCGQVCHTPMHPQFTAWESGQHANVACVDCHIGEGGRALVKYKLAGVRQMIHVMTGKYPRPIPASQAELRPAIETCGRCHTASLNHGQPLRLYRDYADDAENSETLTELVMYTGGPGQPTSSGRAIHWHADPLVRVEYTYTDDDRQTIPFVRVTGRDGKVKEFVVEGTTPEALKAGTTRVMDCIDCHNAAAHRISPTPEQAVDRAIAAGAISRGLPFVREEAVKLLTAEHAGDANAAIDKGLRSFYSGERGNVDPAALRQAIERLQGLYRTNVFPLMKVTWGTYRDNRGHTTSDGCFRCHDGSHVARDGTSINNDCAYCHEEK